MGPHSPLISGFPRRKNPDGTYDSICPRCVATIASSDNEADLLAQERKHVCDEIRLSRLRSRPPTANESDPKKMI
jgi:hypothetical protein